MEPTKNGKIQISLADLTHTGQLVASNTFPYGISLIAAHALKKFVDQVDIALFKYPQDLETYLEKTTPKIACFSNYSWNVKLAYEHARRIKERFPSTVIIFGGPNYPLEADEQEDFLKTHPAIDFHVWFEGEQCFVTLLNALFEVGLNAKKLKESRLQIPSCHYLDPEGKIVRGELFPRLMSLDEIPSPFLARLMDKFFDGVLIPMIQTNRGCPFTCTFCTEGQAVYNKVYRLSTARVRDDLEYIAERVSVPDLLIVDSNFGMYLEDLETCRILSSIQEKYNWPKFIGVSSGKNQKERVLDAAAIVKGAMSLSASIQSADPEVLKNISRRNISLEQLVEVSKRAEVLGAKSYSEIILCLPGDTKEKHCYSVFSMIDSGVDFLRMYQLMMLPGSDLAGRASRKQYGMVTRYRVLPRCFGRYKLYGETFPVAEIEEICVANNTMSYQDYLECRKLNLTVECFYNSGIFHELSQLLRRKNIPTSTFVRKVHERIMTDPGPLKSVYEGFLRETDEALYENREELEGFIKQPEVVDRYISEELGNNELFRYRALAFFEHMKDLHKIAFETARELLTQKDALNKALNDYLKELMELSLLRKQRLLSFEMMIRKVFHFDFAALAACNFAGDPLEHSRPEGVWIEIAHDDLQKNIIPQYIRQYGLSVTGLGRILLRSHLRKLYRRVRNLQRSPDEGREKKVNGSEAEESVVRFV